MRNERIACVQVPRSGTSPRIGTGCLIGTDLILTARHVVYREKSGWNGDEPITVRFVDSTDDVVVSEVAWDPGEGGLDLLLLRLEEEAKVPFAVILAPGIVDSGQRWKSLGFAKADDGNPIEPRRPAGLVGNVLAAREREIELDASAPFEFPDLWEGCSGAPVFVGEGNASSLCGVITEYRQATEGRRLFAVPIPSRDAQPDFWDVVDEGNESLREISTRLAESLLESSLHHEVWKELKGRDPNYATATSVYQSSQVAKQLLNVTLLVALLALEKVRRELQRRKIQREDPRAAASHLRTIALILLPVRSDRGVVEQVRSDLATGKAIAEIPTSSLTVAEGILAAAQDRDVDLERVPGDYPRGRTMKGELRPAKDEWSVTLAGVEAGISARGLVDVVTQHLVKRLNLDAIPDHRDRNGSINAELANEAELDLPWYLVFLSHDWEEARRESCRRQFEDLRRAFPQLPVLELRGGSSQDHQRIAGLMRNLVCDDWE